MDNKDIFSFNPFKREMDEQLGTPLTSAGIMSKDTSSTAGPMGEQMDDSYDPFSFVERFAKDLVSLFDENEEDKEKLKNTYMVDKSLEKQAAKESVLDELVVDYNAAFERGRSLQETMDTIETMSLLPIGTEGVLQSPTPMSRPVLSAPAPSPRPVLSAPAPQRRPRGLMEDGDGYTTLPQFRSGMTDPDSYEEGEGESNLFETIKDTLSDIGGALIPSAAAAEATSQEVNWSQLSVKEDAGKKMLADSLNTISGMGLDEMMRTVFGEDRAKAIETTIQAESGGRLINESMAYSRDRAKKVFPASKYRQGIDRVFDNPDYVTNGFLNAAGQVAFADVVYGQRMGNSNAGDGFRYRGRGYIQITGKDRYKRIGDIIDEDLVNNPELMLDPAVAKKALIAYFYDKANEDGQKRNIFRKLNAKTLSRIIGHATNTAQDRWDATGLPLNIPSVYAPETSPTPARRGLMSSEN